MSSYFTGGFAPPSGVSSREQVRDLQNALIKQGANIKADGIYGAKTANAYNSMGKQPSGGGFSGLGGFQGSSGYNDSFRESSTSPVKNASNAYATGSQSDIKQLQRALNVQQTGQFDTTTRAAFGRDGNSKLYSNKVDGATVYGVVDGGNGVTPWQNESERRSTNNAHLGRFGLSGDKGYRLINDDGSMNDMGMLGSDGTGGVFSPDGMSSNPNYLQGKLGISRDQLAGTPLANISDKELSLAYNAQRPFANDLYMSGNGWMSSVPSSEANMKVGDIRAELGKLTGQQHSLSGGYDNGILAPFVKPNYYSGGSIDRSGVAERQNSAVQDLLNSMYGGSPSNETSSTPPPQADSGGQIKPPKPPDNIVDAIINGMSAEELKRYRDQYRGE